MGCFAAMPGLHVSSPIPLNCNLAMLVAAEAGGLRRSSGPDLSAPQRLQGCRLSMRSDELVFENACVRASSRDTADQQIGARGRAGRGDPCAGRSNEWLEAGDLTEANVVVVV